MRRREFITLLGGAAAWPLAVRAQQAERVRRIGILFGGFSAHDPEPHARVNAFRHVLFERGWIDGKNVRIELRIGGGDPERVRAYAAELVAMSPDALVANSAPALAALMQETSTIPIVFVNISDPVAGGFVSNLARPGGNITGFTSFEPSMSGKWVELLKEGAPSISRIALIFDPNPAYAAFLGAVEAVASSFMMQVTRAPIRDARDIERSIVSFAAEPNGGLVNFPSTLGSAHRNLIIQLAALHRLPAIYPFRFITQAGGLMSYGVDGVDLWRRTAPYIDQILRGAKPGDLPVQQPTKFELVINLKTARALGLEVPPTLLARADEVIE
jgi:putative ABC transport system substrate-binding protein